MGTKIKGIYQGFLNIFVVKEREMEIGCPKDVKHVAHIGWDGHSGSAPSWMNEFRTGPEFAATSIGNSGSALSPWSCQDFGESMGRKKTTDVFSDMPQPSDLPNIQKKHRRKKAKSTSSPKSSSSTSRSSRAAKAKSKFAEGNPNANIEVM